MIGGMIAAPKRKHHHNNGKKLLGEKTKKNGKHQIDKKGDHTISVDVKDGKIASLHVNHAKKGALPIKKYKTANKMAQVYGFQRASLQLAQAQSYARFATGDAGLNAVWPHSHEQYDALGAIPTERQAAYRQVFRETISADDLNAIRDCTHKGWALGSERSRAEIERLAQLRSVSKGRGRPTKSLLEAVGVVNGV
ncbi:MAG: hypothetical protein ABI583_14830 [Betaproteobacteria bacterium]